MTVDGEHGQIRVGAMISEFGSPSMPRIFDALGLDFAILDCEHGTFDMETVAAMASVAAGSRARLWVRTPAVERDYIGRYLDAGVAAIVAPMIDDAAAAERLVRLAMYPPLGRRGISVTRAHSGYVVPDLSAYLNGANERVALYAQIETRRALENLDSILAVDGLTGVIVGPNDLLGDLGVPGRTGDERLLEAIRRVIGSARAAGRSAGIITGERHLIDIARAAGADFVSVNSDIGYLLRGAREQLSGLGLLTLTGR